MDDDIIEYYSKLLIVIGITMTLSILITNCYDSSNISQELKRISSDTGYFTYYGEIYYIKKVNWTELYFNQSTQINQSLD